jgi:hypothetical protein
MSDPKCTTCGRDPKRMNSWIAECSHVECPHRGRVTVQPRDDLDYQLESGCRTSRRELVE